jgi:hypothetical protein
MTYKEALLAFINELKERTKPNEELHFYYKQIEKTLDFEPNADDRFLNFYTDILFKELTNLKEGSDLENAINILYSTNEKVCNLQLALVRGY